MRANETAPKQSGPFARGMRAAADGLKLAFQEREIGKAYVRVVLGLFALTLVLDGAALWTLFAQTAPAADARSLVVVGLWALRVLGTVAIFVAGPLVAIFTINIIFPFFNQGVFLAGLRAVDPDRADALEQAEGMAALRSAWGATRRLVGFLSMSVLFLLVGLIPVVGSVAGAIGQAWLTARTISWELLDPYFDCIDLRYPDQRKLIREHRRALLGFGLPISLMLAVPLVGPLFFGLAQAATGTFLTREIPLHPKEGRAPSSGLADPILDQALEQTLEQAEPPNIGPDA